MDPIYDETTDRTEDHDFYRDSFGERITREGDDTLPGDEDALADDDTVTGDDEAAPPADEDFHERIDRTDPWADLDSNEPAQMDQPGSDFESSSSSEPSMADKIRQKFDDLSGGNRT